MSRKYKANNPEGFYFITCTIIGWVDLFIRQEYKDILINSLNFCIQNKGLKVHAYVIMSSHIHLIVSTEDGIPLSSVIRDFKTFTSKALLKSISDINESRREWMLNKFSYEATRVVRGSKFKLWQDGFHPVELLTPAMAFQKLEYIHNNPVAEKIVDEAEDYVYSSARQYAGKVGELEIEYII
ncbi:MAG: transposase [Cytophagales bacterium CG12_big_fil_rev_8_21_14_0_65_40_12]|nr:MAG: transposase [Cytophagales bacterium CG12_big_fil_rev_8_21_14_0_65_40_12]PIW06345.1 MAG: transposase [Cytophagales bacterium CG17_big_fil_post_rev_8_21_14_2_50_40_13]